MYPFHALYTLYRQSCRKINTTCPDEILMNNHKQIDVDMAPEAKISEAKSSEIKSTQDLLDEYRSIEIGNLVHVPTHLTRATFNCTARAMSRLEMDKILAVMAELEDNPSDIIHVPVGHTHDVEDIDREERPL